MNLMRAAANEVTTTFECVNAQTMLCVLESEINAAVCTVLASIIAQNFNSSTHKIRVKYMKRVLTMC